MEFDVAILDEGDLTIEEHPFSIRKIGKSLELFGLPFLKQCEKIFICSATFSNYHEQFLK